MDHSIKNMSISGKKSSNFLYDIDPNSIPFIPNKNKLVDARVIDVYDGDTCTVIHDYEGRIIKDKIRVLGIDTPEKVVRDKTRKGTKLGDLEEEAGEHVKRRVEELLKEKIIKIKIKKDDKYGGRVNGTVYLPPGSEWDTLTEYLISKKYGKGYSGKKKEKWTEEELNYILEN